MNRPWSLCGPHLLGRRSEWRGDFGAKTDSPPVDLKHHPTATQLEIGTGGTATPPRYLQAEFSAGAHPLRSTANACRLLPLPEKTSQIVIPAWSAGSSESSIATSAQNQTITEVDPVDTTIASIATTIAGKVVVSRQLLDQSSPDSRIDEVIASDLGSAYGAQLDSSVLTGSGSGLMTGLMNVAGISTIAAGGSVAGLVEGLILGYQQMVNTRYRKPNVCIMHPRRWLSGFANAIDLQGAR